MLAHLSMSEVKDHYGKREVTHKRLITLFTQRNVDEYARLAVGLTDAAGNYSAHEHNLGPRILSENTVKSIFDLAEELFACKSVNHIPNIVYKHRLPYLKISVGSEMALMLRPNDFWVGNVRTIWSQLLIKHNLNYRRANEELSLYKDSERSSEMDYQIWRDIYLSLGDSLAYLAEIGNKKTNEDGVEPGRLKYLWADAIANALFDKKD